MIARRRGMTLLEVLVASVVLALGAVLAMAAISTSLAVGSDLQAMAEGQRIAASQLALHTGGALSAPASDRVTRGEVEYVWRLDVRRDVAGLSRAVCVVEWRKAGTLRRYSLERLIPPTEIGP